MMMQPSLSSSYDRVPYPSNPFPQTHPDRLATVATLYGMNPAPPPVETARVLEIGCAQAVNLIPLALQHPHARLVGIDASGVQIATAMATARELQLTNLELHHMDLMQFPPTLGGFDYIICHGVYSWVPDPVRDGILGLMRRHLNPNGVAYVSYNTYPGWRLLGTVRDILLYETREIDDPDAKVQRARDTIEFLLKALPEGDAFHTIVKSVSGAFTSPDHRHYLLHEYFEVTNEPVYFHEFVARAGEHGLQFLSEAALEDMQTHRLLPAAQAAIKALDSQPLERQQYLDFIRCRPFRQTLLCHAGVEIDRALRRERLESLYFASGAKPNEPDDNPSTRDFMTFHSENGGELRSNHPLTKASMMHLREAWPQAVRCDALEVVARARSSSTPIMVHHPADFERERGEWLDNLLQLVVTGLIEAHVAPPRLTTEVSPRPTASRWARRQAAQGRPVTNLRHCVIATDDVQRRILSLLDGTRTPAEVLDALLASAEAEGLIIVHEGRKLDDRVEIRRALAAGLPQELKAAARKGLLIA